MEDSYRMLYYLVSGFKKWEEQKEIVPVEVYQGQLLLIKECSRTGVEPPNGLPNLVKFLEMPSVEWGIPNLKNIFPPDASLLDKDIGVTIEAEDFLEDFQSPDEFEQSVMKQILLYCRNNSLDDQYRVIRTFVSNSSNAVISFQKIYEFNSKINDQELANLFFSCYEKIDYLDHFRRCPHCGWTLEWKNGHWRCNKESICHTLKDFNEVENFTKTGQKYFRLTPGIQKYVLLPGISEMRIAEKMRKKGYKVIVYPNIDEYDIEIEANENKVLIDVKDYRSPFQLAQYMNRINPNKLNEKVWYVVPDYRLKQHPGYLKKVRSFIQDDRKNLVIVLSEKKAIKEAEGKLI